MTKAEILRLLTALKASYPRAAIERDTVEAYATMLADLDFEGTKAAINRIICSSKWFPSIAEIREEVANGETAGVPDAEVAWGYVWKAIAQFGAYRAPVFEHPEVAAAVDVIGWRNICLDENVAATRARFTDAYRAIRSRRVEAIQLGEYAPPERRLPERGGQKSLAQVLALAVGSNDEE